MSDLTEKEGKFQSYPRCGSFQHGFFQIVRKLAWLQLVFRLFGVCFKDFDSDVILASVILICFRVLLQIKPLARLYFVMFLQLSLFFSV